MEQQTLRQQIENFKRGDYSATDRDTQIDAGWYDWFCRDSSLPKKTNSLYRKVISISKSKKINLDESYIIFKNNCPCNGNLYDDFRICDERGVIFTVTPKSGHISEEGLGSVWGRENNFKGPLFSGTWTEIKEWFNQ